MTISEFIWSDRVHTEYEHSSRAAFDDGDIENGIGLRQERRGAQSQWGCVLHVRSRFGARHGDNYNRMFVDSKLDFGYPDVILQTLRERDFDGAGCLFGLPDTHSGVGQRTGQLAVYCFDIRRADGGTVGDVESNDSRTCGGGNLS